MNKRIAGLTQNELAFLCKGLIKFEKNFHWEGRDLYDSFRKRTQIETQLGKELFEVRGNIKKKLNSVVSKLNEVNISIIAFYITLSEDFNAGTSFSVLGNRLIEIIEKKEPSLSPYVILFPI